jgi:hypothetical protein
VPSSSASTVPAWKVALCDRADYVILINGFRS